LADVVIAFVLAIERSRKIRERDRRRIPSYSPSKFGIHGENIPAPVVRRNKKFGGFLVIFGVKRRISKPKDGPNF